MVHMHLEKKMVVIQLEMWKLMKSVMITTVGFVLEVIDVIILCAWKLKM